MAFLTEYWSKGRPQYIPSETAFHDVSSEVYCGLLVVGIGKQYRTPSISIQNGVLGEEHTVLFLCLCDLVRECHKATTQDCVPYRDFLLQKNSRFEKFVL